ncbi:MAG TPA: N-acetylglucosamine-6-phosphate deacetylase, partial [Gemmataceae bacterium]|nr:N-acetylglucosamine-6-phosphate deacetylase [Gemmataceae bacterium]
MRLRARHYATAEVIDITCADGIIRDVGPPAAGRPDVEAGWVAPALFDLQINGCDGRSFNSDHLGIDDVRHVVRVCRRHGISALFPTLVTNGFDALRHGFSTLRQACEEDAEVAAAVPGLHLEGPYISAEDGPRGAHPR